MNKISIEISEEESWAVVTALMEYSKNPINDEHGKLVNDVYLRLKAIMLDKIEKEFLDAR